MVLQTKDNPINRQKPAGNGRTNQPLLAGFTNPFPVVLRWFNAVGNRYAPISIPLALAMVFVAGFHCYPAPAADAFALIQQQPLNNGPLQPTVIGQSQEDSSSTINPETQQFGPLSTTPNSQGTEPNLGGWGQSPARSEASGFPSDFNVINRGNDAVAFPASNSANGSNTITGSQNFGSSLSTQQATPWSNTNAPSNSGQTQLGPTGDSASPGGSVAGFSGNDAHQQSAVGAADSHADHPNHDPAFHVDHESQIDRGNRTDGTGISLQAIRNPELAPLSPPARDELVGRQSLQPIQSNSGSGSLNSRIDQAAGEQRGNEPPGAVDSGNLQAQDQPVNDPVNPSWLTAGNQSGSGQSAAADQAPNLENSGQAGASRNNGQSMRDMLGQQTNPVGNSGVTGVGEGRFPTAALRQDSSFLQQPGRLPGALNNFGQSNPTANDTATNNPSIFAQQNNLAAAQQGAMQSPVVQGGRGDYATGNAMLPRDRAAQTYNDPSSSQYNTAQNDAAMLVKQQLFNSFPSVHITAERPIASPATFAQPLQAPRENVPATSTPVRSLDQSDSGGGNESIELAANTSEFQFFSTVVFWLSISINLILWYLLVDSRNNYRDLADELQDRFFRDTE